MHVKRQIIRFSLCSRRKDSVHVKFATRDLEMFGWSLIIMFSSLLRRGLLVSLSVRKMHQVACTTINQIRYLLMPIFRLALSHSLSDPCVPNTKARISVRTRTTAVRRHRFTGAYSPLSSDLLAGRRAGLSTFYWGSHYESAIRMFGYSHLGSQWDGCRE